jgi:site-specific recombinase XerD
MSEIILKNSLVLDKNIDNVIEHFLNSYNSNQTKKRYKKVLKEFFSQKNIKSLKDLANFHISEIKDFCLNFIYSKAKYEDSKSDIILNPATINNSAYTLRAFFKYLVNYYDYPKNPL